MRWLVVLGLYAVVATATARANPRDAAGAAALRTAIANGSSGQIAKLVAYPIAVHDVVYAKPVLATARDFKKKISLLLQSDVVAELASDATVQFQKQPPAEPTRRAAAMLGRRARHLAWYTLLLDRSNDEIKLTVHAGFDGRGKLTALVWVLERAGGD